MASVSTTATARVRESLKIDPQNASPCHQLSPPQSVPNVMLRHGATV
jgi:hypothetical protein